MLPDVPTVQVIATLFVATVIASAFGFGEALVAVPLLALFMPMDVVVPLVVLVSITLGVVVTAQDWRQVEVRSTGTLLLFSALGTPFGLGLLMNVPAQLVKGLLALVIMAFSVYSLTVRRTWPGVQRREWLFGFMAGVLGSAYGMPGPPVVMYGTMRGWSPQHFRATLQGYFLPASIITAVGYWFTNLWSPAVIHYFVASLPGVLVAIFLGGIINRRLSGQVFHRYVHIGLIVIGLMLLGL